METIHANTIIMAAALLTALGSLFGAVFSAYRWYLKQEKQDRPAAMPRDGCFCAGGRTESSAPTSWE